MSVDKAESFKASFLELLPTAAELDVMLAEESWRRECVPIVENRLALPVNFIWQDGTLHKVVFESYDDDTPLGQVSARVYQDLLKRPEAESIRCLVVGNVACEEFKNSQLLGDAVDLLARAGLPPNLERLDFARVGPISNSGDLGYYAITDLTPLLPKLSNIVELAIGGCRALGKMDLPKLRELFLHNEVSAKNLKELSRAKLPMLERLELEQYVYWEPELRFKAARALLRSKGFPRLKHLVLVELDIDEDQRLELEEDEDAEAEPDAWVEMIADSVVLKKLSTLRLSFREDSLQLPQLVDRAEAFRHLDGLEFWGGRGNVRLEHPTREAIQAAFER